MIPDFEKLLDVQRLDSQIAQLEHRHNELPVRAEIATIEADIAEVEKTTATVQAERDEVSRAQKRLEDQVALIEDKLSEINAKLYDGGVTSPKEAQTLQEEIASITRHRSSIEDGVLEQMELAEPLDSQLETFAADRAKLDESLESAQGRLKVEGQDIETELDAVRADRGLAAAGLADGLLDTYEAGREDFGASTIVVLEGSNCKGCPLAMPAMEVDRAKKAPADQLYNCEECGRYVVK